METVTFFSKLLKLSFWSSGYLTDSAQCTRRRNLTVEDHVHLLSTQFLAKTLDPEHPSHDVSTAPQAPHPLRHTLTSKYCGSVSPLTTGDISPPGQCGDVIKSLHTSAVESSIRKLDAKPNRVLGSRPPPIHATSKSLPRPWRSTVSQFRSGWCRCLKSYGALLDNNVDNNCPE